jgi:heptosyltransferase-1
MGDVIHALPAVATLKHSFPGSTLAWVVDPRWAPLLAGNPFIDRLIEFDRRSAGSIREAWRELRRGRYDVAVDFQGLIKSALIASMAWPDRIYGFHQAQLREKAAALFYSNRTLAAAAHVVDRNLELAAAAGASTILRSFPLPKGEPDGDLPEADFVLANPLSGWGAKQWPFAFYEKLGQRLEDELRVKLVVNGPAEAGPELASLRHAWVHVSGIPGLIHATRRALAVVGGDSGPLHLAAALAKPGVAIFGPTDPERNGPYGGSIAVLRAPGAVTTYKRRRECDPAMEAITPEAVFQALVARIAARRAAGSPAS